MLTKFFILIFTVFIFGINCKIIDEEFLNFDTDRKLSTRFRRQAQQDAWEKRKLRYIYDLQMFLGEHLNISIIGWQNIWDSDGKIQEVESIELTFPMNENSTPRNNLLDKINWFDRAVQHKLTKLYDTKESDERIKEFYIDYHYMDKRSIAYLNPTTVYFNPDGLATYNKTTETSKQEVDSFIESILKRKSEFYLPPVILKYDSLGTIKSDDTKISGPAPMVYVSDSWNAPDGVLLQGPQIFTNIYFSRDKKDIPEELAKDFNLEFPDYQWRVLLNPGKLYIDKDVWIKMSLDGYEFFENDKKFYLVYGILKV